MCKKFCVFKACIFSSIVVQLEKHHQINQEIINPAEFSYAVKLEYSVLVLCYWHCPTLTQTFVWLPFDGRVILIVRYYSRSRIKLSSHYCRLENLSCHTKYITCGGFMNDVLDQNVVDVRNCGA